MKNNLTPLALAIAAGVAMPVSAQADLIISEYVEGSGYEKAIELFNNTGSTVDLSNYQLVKFTNGNASSKSTLALSGSLPDGSTYVIAHSSSSDAMKAKAQLLNGSVTNFNGDDPVELQTTAGNTVDQIGVFGDKDFGKDKTLARKSSALNASSSYQEDDWDVLAKNTIEGLGKAPVDGGGTPPPPAWVCEGDMTPVYAIQGEGDSSPLVPEGSFSGDIVTVKGVITKRVESLYKGFFIQDAEGDDNDLTSDGIFVYTGSAPATDIREGATVCLQGQVKEFFNQTQVSLSETNYQILDENPQVSPAYLQLDPELPLEEQLEAYEGMLVTTTNSDLVVTRNFGFDYDSFRNNMVLSLSAPLYKPTQKHPALSDEAKQLAAQNSKGHLFVETDQKPANGDLPYFSGFNAEDGYIRIGDKVDNLEGVIGFSYSEYRLIPATDENLVAADFQHDFTDRTDQPELPANRDLTIASFNVLNYFNSGVGGDSNPLGQNRGAGNNEADFDKQRTKIINAMVAMDADIIGLMEIENNGFGSASAIQNLINGLNAELANADDHYQFVQSPDGKVIGTDAITVGLLYRPAKVSLDGQSNIIEMPIQKAKFLALQGGEEITKDLFKGQRNALVQTFNVSLEDGQQRDLTVVVNHLKSKGSQCFNDFVEYQQPVPLTSSGRIDERNAKRVDGYEDDLQGSCNEFRLSAAEVLGDYMRSNTAGDVLVMGDLNAYGKEDPVRLLTDYQGEGRKLVTAPYTFIGEKPLDGDQGRELDMGYGYINLAEFKQGTEAFSYSFDGELGSLDHVLGSGSITAKLSAVTDWHINSVENSLFEYSRRYSGSLEKSDNVFSSSDHDPILLTLDYSLSETQTVSVNDLSDAKVSLEMQDYNSDILAQWGVAYPEFSTENEDQTGLLTASDDLLKLSAIETIDADEVLYLDSVSTAWSLALQKKHSLETLLAMDAYDLRRAKLDLKRRDVTRAATAVELSKVLDMDSDTLVEAVLNNPYKSLPKVLVEVLELDMKRKEARVLIREIKSYTKPAVRESRREIIRG
ncbi:ExeM/NucH family extracellular endonuclease [Endozoicomonas arenosclerae]|uniref:ExeM/NucH family extracellular endonuclease n=1 Tax=Endozoicomonas arenosclerae TaxID=1633495 RepID=UPI0007824FF1|nr:ExeM/NucH family extracellular endonuclease [Endozoicomonas arenosclerae]